MAVGDIDQAVTLLTIVKRQAPGMGLTRVTDLAHRMQRHPDAASAAASTGSATGSATPGSEFVRATRP